MLLRVLRRLQLREIVPAAAVLAERVLLVGLASRLSERCVFG
jgi:hypothetical protein